MLSKEIKDFVGKLRTVKHIADQEKVTVQTIYKKLQKGKYDWVNIDGKIFIVTK